MLQLFFPFKSFWVMKKLSQVVRGGQTRRPVFINKPQWASLSTARTPSAAENQ